MNIQPSYTEGLRIEYLISLSFIYFRITIFKILILYITLTLRVNMGNYYLTSKL
jgi:hypothetical protein